MTFGPWFADAPRRTVGRVEPWICDRCNRVNLEGEVACADCGGDPTPHTPSPASGAVDRGGVAVVRAVQDDNVVAAMLAAPASGPPAQRQPMPAEPFFQLTEPPRPRRRRDALVRLWPILVLLVVLLFFAAAGLSRSV